MLFQHADVLELYFLHRLIIQNQIYSSHVVQYRISWKKLKKFLPFSLIFCLVDIIFRGTYLNFCAFIFNVYFSHKHPHIQVSEQDKQYRKTDTVLQKEPKY